MSAYQPRRPTTCQRPRPRPPRLPQLSRHPDACLFIPSRTVTDEPGIARQSERRNGLGRAIRREPDGTHRPGGTVLVSRLLTYVEQEDSFPPAQQVVELREGDPIRGEEFFFSSRRRHTRLQGDWSSDVCSSD